MNFTREPILETIISAKEGFKLKIKSTKNEGGTEFLVDAVEVVCLGTTFFYRSGEPSHTFFIPAQDFEICQVREARLLLKTPTEKAIKIAGGAEGGEKSKEHNQQNSKPHKEKVQEKKVEQNKQEPNKQEPKGEANVQKKHQEQKEVKQKQEKKPHPIHHQKKSIQTNADAEIAPKEAAPSIFSHLLTPPEALISESIHKYQNIIDDQKEQKMKKEAELQSFQPEPPMPSANDKVTASSVDQTLTFEKIEQVSNVKRPLSLKEKMRKVLSPTLKDPAQNLESQEKE
jgi:hypothetical protein